MENWMNSSSVISKQMQKDGSIINIKLWSKFSMYNIIQIIQLRSIELNAFTKMKVCCKMNISWVK